MFNIWLEIKLLKLLSYLPGENELNTETSCIACDGILKIQ